MRRTIERQTIGFGSSVISEQEGQIEVEDEPEGMARFQFMSGNRDLSLDIAQGVIDIAEMNGRQADSQDVCNMIDEMKKIN